MIKKPKTKSAVDSCEIIIPFIYILQAGFALGIILLILMAGICLYSCYLIVKCAEETGVYQVLTNAD